MYIIVGNEKPIFACKNLDKASNYLRQLNEASKLTRNMFDTLYDLEHAWKLKYNDKFIMYRTKTGYRYDFDRYRSANFSYRDNMMEHLLNGFPKEIREIIEFMSFYGFAIEDFHNTYFGVREIQFVEHRNFE